MSDVPLTLAMADYDRTAPLRDGSVKPAGIDLTYHVSPPSETFWRMLKFDEFDASEMSLSSFLIARAQGRKWTAIPVFPYRTFFHMNVFVRADAGITKPSDLAGKRFGLPEYQVTAAVWVRGALEHDFGLAPKDVKWLIERRAGMSHGTETGFKAPQGVSVEHVPDGQTLGSMLENGTLEALMPSPYPGMTSMLNRTDLLQLTRAPYARLLFPDPLAEGARYFARHGFSHINHTVVIRDEVLEKHPWIALSLYRAFAKAKEQCYAKLDYLLRSSVMAAFGVLENQRKAFGDDPFPYGLRANRAALEALISYSVEQGLTAKPVAVDELFAPTTRDL
jgi:4,5-dihydroxyphthalate decarboxylase